MTAFSELGLSPGLLRAAAELGWSEPTPIQAAAIPPALAGRDVLASAATGSGKTGAYALAALQRIDDIARSRPRRPRVLLLVPTRELAAQVGEALRRVERFLNMPAKLAVLVGGLSINPQLLALRGGADVVVATPGRLLDVVDRNALDLSGLHTLVLDEADRLLEGGFADELARVLALLPTRRQNLLFSATFTPTVEALAQRLLHDPVRVDVGHQAAAVAAIAERAIVVDPARRTPLLARLIAQEGWSRVLVFVATRYACDHVADKLCRARLAAAAFHGDASQGERTQVLNDFKAGRLRVLVATDLGCPRHRHPPAARGRQPRPAALHGGLRAPHRPHGASWCGGAGGELRQRGDGSALPPHREAPGAARAARAGAGLRTHADCCARTHHRRREGPAAQQEGQAARRHLNLAMAGALDARRRAGTGGWRRWPPATRGLPSETVARRPPVQNVPGYAPPSSRMFCPVM